MADKDLDASAHQARFQNANDLWPQQFLVTTKTVLWDRLNFVVDVMQNILDLIGLVPVIGDVVDVVNGVIYAARGKMVDAAFSFGFGAHDRSCSEVPTASNRPRHWSRGA